MGDSQNLQINQSYEYLSDESEPKSSDKTSSSKGVNPNNIWFEGSHK